MAGLNYVTFNQDHSLLAVGMLPSRINMKTRRLFETLIHCSDHARSTHLHHRPLRAHEPFHRR